MKNEIGEVGEFDKNKLSHNLLVILFTTLLFTIFSCQAPGMSGWQGIGNLLFPPLIGIFTLLTYLVTRWITNERTWVVTMIGTTINLILSIYLYFNPH